MVVVKFLVFVSEVVSIFSKILTWIIGGQKDTFAPPTQLLGGACPGCPLSLRLWTIDSVSKTYIQENSTSFYTTTTVVFCGLSMTIRVSLNTLVSMIVERICLR